MSKETDRKKLDANPYYMDRYGGKDAVDKMMAFVLNVTFVLIMIILAVLDVNGSRTSFFTLAAIYSWIPMLYFYEYRQLKKFETTGEPPETLF